MTYHSDLRKAAEELIKEWDWECGEFQNKALTELIEVLRQALAQPEQMTDKEKLAQWMIQKGYATGHGDTVEDLLNELEWQILENWHRAMVNGVETEREACAKFVDHILREGGGTYGDAIRARGDK